MQTYIRSIHTRGCVYLRVYITSGSGWKAAFACFSGALRLIDTHQTDS